jgi:hypothetical protein
VRKGIEKKDDSLDYKIYKEFILYWIQYKNPNWKNIEFVKKLENRIW